MHIPRLAILTTTLLAAAASLAPPASAEQLENDHFTFVDSHIEQEEHGLDFCGGTIEFPVLWQGEGKVFVHAVRRGDGLVYFADKFHAVESYTNTLNGKSLTFDTTSRGGDQKVVDNGDGTLTITFKSTGRTFVYGPDGERLFVDAGQFLGQFVVDHGGTPGDPDDDEFLEDLGELKLTGRQDSVDRDFCADLVTFLG